MASTVARSPGVACPCHHSQTAMPIVPMRSSSIAAVWAVPLQVARTQVARVRSRQRRRMRAVRASSRGSAPKALTTALAPTASASVPPSRVSQALERRAAGATQPRFIDRVSVMCRVAPRPTTSPISGQRQPSSSVAPTSTTSAGSSATRMVSCSRSSALIPRVIWRTVEPAKLPACQSAEKRCTRAKLRSVASTIARRVMRMMARKAMWRSASAARPSRASAASAASMARRARSRSARAAASTRRPAKIGTSRSARVAASMAVPMAATRRRCRAQPWRTKFRTSRMGCARRCPAWFSEDTMSCTPCGGTAFLGTKFRKAASGRQDGEAGSGLSREASAPRRVGFAGHARGHQGATTMAVANHAALLLAEVTRRSR